MKKLLTRRDYLSACAALAAAITARHTHAAPEALASAPAPGGYIDAHVHVWTDDTERYPLAPDQKKENMRPASFTPEELFRHTRPCGVGRVNLIQMSYYGFDNSYLLDVMERYPGIFAGTAIVDPFGPDLEAEMLRLATKRCFAFRIQPAHSKQPPESWLQPEPMDRMFAIAAKHNLVLSALIRLDALPELDRMCAKYPAAPVIIDHLCLLATGDTFPVRQEHIDTLTRMSAHKNVYIKVGAFYALGERTPPYLDLLPIVRQVIDAFTPERCMWESDSPFQIVQHSYADSIALIRDHADFLSAADKEALLRGTAEKLLFRP